MRSPDDYHRIGKDPEPMTAGEWAIIVAGLFAALAIIGGIVWLCLLIIRG